MYDFFENQWLFFQVVTLIVARIVQKSNKAGKPWESLEFQSVKEHVLLEGPIRLASKVTLTTTTYFFDWEVNYCSFRDDTNFVSGFSDQGPFYQHATNFHGGGVMCEFAGEGVLSCSMKASRERPLVFFSQSENDCSALKQCWRVPSSLWCNFLLRSLVICSQ